MWNTIEMLDYPGKYNYGDADGQNTANKAYHPDGSHFIIGMLAPHVLLALQATVFGDSILAFCSLHTQPDRQQTMFNPNEVPINSFSGRHDRHYRIRKTADI